MNDEIEIIEAKALEVKEEIKSFQGNLVIKSQKIAEQELQLKWFAEKQKIFAQQKEDMMKTKMELQSRLEKVMQDSESERERFLEEAEQFSSMYDLISDGRKKREVTAKKKLEDLVVLKQKLTSEIHAIKNEKNEIESLESKKEKLLLQINDLESEHKDINNLMKEKGEETRRLESEKEKIAEKAQNDPELQRLTAELQTCKENSISLEGICDALKQELREVQQQYYQKQLQKQKRERQQQKQQHEIQWQKQQQQQLQHLQRQQLKDQSQQDQEKCPTNSGLGHVLNSQDKRNQRPLFENPLNIRRQRHNIVSGVDSSNSAGLRFQQFLKRPRFPY